VTSKRIQININEERKSIQDKKVSKMEENFSKEMEIMKNN
jgi:hypothetical protein